MSNQPLTSHERCEADLAELAAGVLGGQEEAALLRHLASCPRCAAQFERLASAAKSLLVLVLEMEPPVGFDSRFLDRIESRYPTLAANVPPDYTRGDTWQSQT